jgi:prepilin signal peptidase PulO-like enzyme (type II secretory pathway)
MDFNILSEYFVFVVVLACLAVGYCIKTATVFKKIKNNDIPVILAVFGLLLNLVVSGLSVESAVYGAVMGLCSTGLHQAFKEQVEKNKIVVKNTKITKKSK